VVLERAVDLAAITPERLAQVQAQFTGDISRCRPCTVR
jgi:tRNA pseudouridine55 synthase